MKQVHKGLMDQFQVHVTKEGVEDKKANVGRSEVTSLDWAEQRVTNDVMGHAVQIALESGYASSIHTSQGLTLSRVRGLLEGIFAHGQTYVLISRTPDEEQFWCVGVPPQDILLDVMKAVQQQDAAAKGFLAEYQALDAESQACVLSDSKSISENLIPLQRHISLVFDRLTHSKAKDSMSAEEILGLLLMEAQRLDLLSGIENMISITSRFTAGKIHERRAVRHDVFKLHAFVKYKQKLKAQGKERNFNECFTLSFRCFIHGNTSASASSPLD